MRRLAEVLGRIADALEGIRDELRQIRQQMPGSPESLEVNRRVLEELLAGKARQRGR